MYPILFHVPYFGFPIYSYGLMLAIGFLGAIYLARFLARRAGLDPDVFVNAGMLAMISGVVGARVSHIIENWASFTRSDFSWSVNLWHMVNIRAGGLTYYGGFLLAVPCLLFYLHRKRVPLRLASDIIAPCIMIGLGVGRVGCFLNGCCFGAVCSPNTPFAITYPYWSIPYQTQLDEGQIKVTGVPAVLRNDTGAPADPQELLHDASESGTSASDNSAAVMSVQDAMARQRSLPVHPSQLYSTVTALLIAALCVSFIYLPHAPGRVFALMMIVEGPSRFLLEMLRVEPPVLGPMSLSMVLGIGIFVAGVVLWIVMGKLDGKRERYSPIMAGGVLAT